MAEERRHDYPQIMGVMNELKSDVKNVLKILNGNGDLGLVAKVKINTFNMQDIMNTKKVSFWKVTDCVLRLASGAVLIWVAYILNGK